MIPFDKISKYTNITDFTDYDIFFGSVFNIQISNKYILYRKRDDHEYIDVCSADCHLDNRLGPAYIVLLKGELKQISYCYNGELHNLFGPAYITYYMGKKKAEAWYLRGKLHNTSGPAKRVCSYTGIWVNDFAIDGILISKDKFCERVISKW